MYDDIAELYHLIYPDWEAAIERQATALDRLVSDTIGPPPHALLDVSCGIGTQVLGLAARGYRVTASDLSAGAIARARREARQRGLAIEFSVADMRNVTAAQAGAYDVVLSADNSLPHLAGHAEIRRALRGFLERLRPGGMAVVGIRDYAAAQIDRSSPQMHVYGIREHDGHRHAVFQTREWHDDGYEAAMYFVREGSAGSPPALVSGRSRYYVVLVEEMVSMVVDAGFDDVRRLDGVMHQPLIVGRRP